MLTAVATDNTNMTTVSAAIDLNVTPPGDGDLLVLQDGLGGYSGTRDTFLDGYQTTFPKGNEDRLNSIANLYNPLVRFAIFSDEGGPVPKGSTVTYAALAVYKSSFYDYSYRAHPLLVNWVENKATWIRAADGIPWNAPGAAGIGTDYAANGSPAALTGWNPEWVVLDVTDSVQSMSLGQQSNFGWQLLGNGVNYHKFFRASEYAADRTQRPKLILQIGNKRPSVSLKAPKRGARYTIGDTITLSANATDQDGSVTRVEFFNKSVSLGVDTTAPYSISWSNVPFGTHVLTAVATDNAGTATSSSAVTMYALLPGC